MQSTIVTATYEYIVELFQKKLTEHHRFHDLAHTLSVKETAVLLAEEIQLSEDEQEILALAALFHDSGFSETYTGHEEVSKKIAQQFLTDQDYPTEKIEQVIAIIEATKPETTPQTTLEKIIRDADMAHLGRERYLISLENLRHEWTIFLDKEYEDAEWFQMNSKFLKEHTFHTEVAQRFFGEQEEENRKTMKKLHKKEQKLHGKLLLSTSISGSSTARMAFKTALRNHIDLTSIADNKSNIMLSINAIIITITMPLLADNIDDNSYYLLAPSSILLTTCVLSIIFATLATRPIKTTGVTDLEKLKTKQSNLFFFGNFYKMSFQDYKRGIEEVIGEQEILEDSIIMDLYGLGKALGSKFNQLRICYNIFMVGMTLTVIAFAVAFILGA